MNGTAGQRPNSQPLTGGIKSTLAYRVVAQARQATQAGGPVRQPIVDFIPQSGTLNLATEYPYMYRMHHTNQRVQHTVALKEVCDPVVIQHIANKGPIRIHKDVQFRFMYSQDRSAYFVAAKQADRSWEYLTLLDMGVSLSAPPFFKGQIVKKKPEVPII